MDEKMSSWKCDIPLGWKCDHPCENMYIIPRLFILRATSRTQDWEPMTSTLQAISLVEKAELVQERFTLRSRDQRSKGMQDGCKVYMDSYMASNGSCFMVTWTILNKTSLEGRPNTKLGDHGTLNDHSRWFIHFYHVWGWIESHWNSIWLRHPVTYDFTLHFNICDHATWFWRCLGTPLDTFFWALTISWSRLLSRVWSGPKMCWNPTRPSKNLKFAPMDDYECNYDTNIGEAPILDQDPIGNL